MKVTGFILKDGEEISLGKFSVLVGPNNVGKSQTLKDIATIMSSGRRDRTVILKELNFERPGSFEEFMAGLEVVDSQNINKFNKRTQRLI